ncbi:hypothetical protein Poli38472_008130 [Pythium oligandrum]|uniref:Apple domain-containing protein n=1 Tax=Pythium oligandrum TaxID=41045 RepID=A0A8K1FPC8_PYTOL|nr:hypothetical protein Poli38472_008130 [Pythium oligandrum]|eukprot:TMW65488.1 hypothetical protein Poli38472_008130 [Pythium oligandrum]
MNCCNYGYCQPWNSGYYQCLDTPARCPTQETDIDYYGEDIKTIKGLLPNQCCDECYNTAGCTAYTFVNENSDGKSACYLKKATSGRVEKKGAVSAKLAEPQAPANCPTQERGVDYYGNDIKNIRGIDQGACCDECGKTSGCTAYTWVPKESDGKSVCYLKTSWAGRKDSAGLFSGRVKDPSPPQNCPVQEVNVDYEGNNLKTVRDITQAQCCDECGKTGGCTAYTFKTTDWDGKSSCFLKFSDNGRKPGSGVISGKITTVPPPSNCPKQETDIDYYGNDIKSLRGIPVGQCCDACATTPTCVGYTFVEKNSDGKTACYLKSGLGGRRPATGAVSGELKCPTHPMAQCGSSQTGVLCCPEGHYCQPWNPSYYQCIPAPENKKCPTMVTGVDFYGADLEVKYGLQPGECCDACYNSKECRVFTFVNYNSDGKSACYLKSAIKEQRVLVGAVSGYKNKLAIVS